MTPYTELPGAAIPVGRQSFADFVATLAAAELGIPRPAVRWFSRIRHPEGWPWETWQDDRVLAGEARPWKVGEVWVAHGLDRRELAMTVAHETHHDGWYRRFGAGSTWYSPGEVQAMEIAAERFAISLLKRWRF